MVKRIYHKHGSLSKRITDGTAKITVKTVNAYLNKAWEKLIDMDVCPWISKTVNDNFKLVSATEARHQMRSRVCLYYMIIRRYLANNNMKCILNKQQTSN